MADTFFWYDVMTTDTVAAGTFYADVVGWGLQDSGSPGYTLFTVGGRGVAGLMPIPDDAAAMGVPPCWMGYIKVDDVDAMAARITAEGGKLLKGPIEIAGVIRFAVVADPQGAGFLIATPLPSEAPPMPVPGIAGTIGWHELYATDWKAAFAFYEKLFGWTKTDAFEMGPMGTYQLFAAGGVPTGGMMNNPEAFPIPYWNYYVNVDGIAAAAKRVTDGGGQILNGPHEVPGGQWIVQCKDPQGAMFAMVSMQK